MRTYDASAPTPRQDFISWSATLKREQIDIWRESLSQLRQLHNDVWNGVRFFLTLNGILFASMGVVVKYGRSDSRWAVAVIAVAGVALTVIARAILQNHRAYYLDMLLRKTLIERELGFREMRIEGVDLVFPWGVPDRALALITFDVEAWRNQQYRRRGTITRKLFIVYESVIAAHITVVFYVAIYIAVH